MAAATSGGDGRGCDLGDKQKKRDSPRNKTARGEGDSPGKRDNQTARTNPSGTLGWGWRVGHERLLGSLEKFKIREGESTPAIWSCVCLKG